MKRSHRAKVTFIEAQNPRCAVASSEHDERAVGEPQSEVRVASFQIDDARVILMLQRSDREAPSRKVGYEGSACGGAETLVFRMPPLQGTV